jgi:Pentapeptide repeats (9 copies)
MWAMASGADQRGKEPRFAGLYATALGRLADPRPPLRVGALRTLELLGQDHPRHRQAIVDVFCAYLRMPAGEDGPVRLAAQRILTAHLRPLAGAAGAFWPDVGLDLTAATLADLDFTETRVDGGATFDFAVFGGPARFRGTVFDGPASFRGALFQDHAWLERSVFGGATTFDGAIFHGDAWFGEASFRGRTTFRGVDFGGHAWFGACEGRGPIDLSDAVFRRSAGFRGATLRGAVTMSGTSFQGPARVSRRDEGWNLCPPGWRVEVDPDNEAVGQLVWAGNTALFPQAA